jgi:hypothetical protein
MTLWSRTPRAVYRVYDEDEYLAGADAPDENEVAPGPVSQWPASESGQSDPAHTENRGAASVAYSGEDCHKLTARFHRDNSSRLLALGLLAGVTASAVGLVALEALRHSPPAHPSSAARRDPLLLARPASPAPIPPASIAHAVSVATVPTSSVPPVPERHVSGPTPHRRRAVVLLGSDAQLPSWPIEESGAVAEVAAQHTAELQVDDEFGFER